MEWDSDDDLMSKDRAKGFSGKSVFDPNTGFKKGFVFVKSSMSIFSKGGGIPSIGKYKEDSDEDDPLEEDNNQEQPPQEQPPQEQPPQEQPPQEQPPQEQPPQEQPPQEQPPQEMKEIVVYKRDHDEALLNYKEYGSNDGKIYTFIQDTLKKYANDPNRSLAVLMAYYNILKQEGQTKNKSFMLLGHIRNAFELGRTVDQYIDGLKIMKVDIKKILTEKEVRFLRYIMKTIAEPEKAEEIIDG